MNRKALFEGGTFDTLALILIIIFIAILLVLFLSGSSGQETVGNMSKPFSGIFNISKVIGV